MMIIYKIENKINGKIYIGQTMRLLKARLADHRKSELLIGKALREYGLQSFEILIIDEAHTKAILDEKEKYWISFYACKTPAGYNCTDGGDVPIHNMPHTEETKKLIREKRALQVITEETKQKQRDWERTGDYKEKCRIAHIGHVVTAETRKKISDGHKGMKASAEAKQKMRLAHLGKPTSRKARKQDCADKPLQPGLAAATG
jgi:group I intron endonuclease